MFLPIFLLNLCKYIPQEVHVVTKKTTIQNHPPYVQQILREARKTGIKADVRGCYTCLRIPQDPTISLSELLGKAKAKRAPIWSINGKIERRGPQSTSKPL